uniref:Secreted protein n=1 Tax=Syphacia muris TaxID=451379 RepID=A0A0N5AVC4_9BILA
MSFVCLSARCRRVGVSEHICSIVYGTKFYTCSRNVSERCKKKRTTKPGNSKLSLGKASFLDNTAAAADADADADAG